MDRGSKGADSYDEVLSDKVKRTDPLGVTTTYVYNDLRQLESVSYSDSTPSVSHTYNAIGEKKTVTDASGTTTYYYDNAGQLTSKVLDADASADTAAGLTESTESTTSDSTETAFQEQPISYSYDPIGELTHISYAGGTEVSYTYLDGLMVSVNDGLGDTTSFAYGANSHLDEITYPQDTSTSTSYGYNPAGVMTTTSVLSKAGNSSVTDMYNSSQMLYAMDWNTGQSFGTAQVCLVESNGFRSGGLVETLGGGGESPTASISGGLLFSNATCVKELGGAFGYVNGGATIGPDASPTVEGSGFIGNGKHNSTITGAVIEAGVAAEFPMIPASAGGGLSYSWTQQLW